MTEVQQRPKVETVEAATLAGELKRVPALASMSDDDFVSLGSVGLVQAEAGADIAEWFNQDSAFWVVLKGQVRVHKGEENGTWTPLWTIAAGETFGEAPLLLGKKARISISVLEPTILVRIQEAGFWKLMACCPQVRPIVLGNMAHRLQVHQSLALHREKLISLGTLAAGLMHELNNPGSAARRAASQLRENLTRLQLISLRFCSGPKLTEGQLECLRGLQEQALEFKRPKPLSSIEQSDAEELLAEWLESHGVENAWKLAPTLAEIGLDAETLRCTQEAFNGRSVSDPLNWVEALISSVRLVGTIEESISRVTDLVKAVKKYAYEDKAQRHQLDIHDGIQNTLLILSHKFRQKEITVEKQFARDLPPVSTSGVGLNQVWTNLLDNAIDAAPEKGHITVRTWVDGPQICIGIADDGPGIAEENKSRIFEPFFTTKPAGEGTGLGLDIVQRIVIGQFGGRIQVDSVPGKTEFIIILPMTS